MFAKIIEIMRKLNMTTFADLLEKYKAVVSYLFFGACATFINIGTYIICFDGLHISNMISNVIAWVTAVIFAFFTFAARSAAVFSSAKHFSAALRHCFARSSQSANPRIPSKRKWLSALVNSLDVVAFFCSSQ